MKQRAALLIGLVASGAVLLQNLPFLGGFVWASIHGAGASSFLAFAPAALGLGLLWTGYFLMKRANLRATTMVFAVCVFAILLANELILPHTPLKAWRTLRSLDGVEVKNLRDEPLMSARGNVIGVRITFEAFVPRTGPYLISASTPVAERGETPWPLHFGRMPTYTVRPEPGRGDDSPFDVLEKNVVYTFTQEMLPNFLDYDSKLKQPCLMEVTTTYISEADVLSALSKNRDVKLRTAVQVDGEYGARSGVLADYVTSRPYDLRAMYDTAVAEGNRRCGRS